MQRSGSDGHRKLHAGKEYRQYEMDGPAVSACKPVPQKDKYGYQDKLPNGGFHGIAASAQGHSHGEPGACKSGGDRKEPQTVAGQTEVDDATDYDGDNGHKGDHTDQQSVRFLLHGQMRVGILGCLSGKSALT